MIKPKVLAAAGLVALSALAGIAPAGADDGHGRHHRDGDKLRFEEFVGVSTSELGAAGAIRGVNGGGAPWSIGEARVTVRRSGRVDVRFEDLIFTGGPNAGKNTVSPMAVVLTCLDRSGNPAKAVSQPFAVTVGDGVDIGGDADARTTITVPEVCKDPIALITNGTGLAWFAKSGR
ncbi:MAG: hypothetical protein AB7W59_06370 [Acidimicrobiia bacterium]